MVPLPFGLLLGLSIIGIMDGMLERSQVELGLFLGITMICKGRLSSSVFEDSAELVSTNWHLSLVFEPC
jgi:hypothetical protein